LTLLLELLLLLLLLLLPLELLIPFARVVLLCAATCPLLPLSRV
jgi:hypothetical protein